MNSLPSKSHGAPLVTPPPKGDTEGFDSDEAIAARTGCTTFQIQTLIREGHLRQAGATATQRFFKTADLNAAKDLAARLLDIVGIRSTVAHLAAGDREAAFWAHVSAAENGRQRLTAADRAEGTRRAGLEVKFNQSIDRAVLRIDAVLDRLDNLARRPAGNRLQLRAVRRADGTLQGVTIMEVNLAAIGKTAMVDGSGQVTRDPQAARRKLQVWTDAQSLSTAMAAVTAAGGELPLTTNHDDSVEARIGIADHFKLEGGRLTADLHFLEAYPGREQMLELAERAPRFLACSIEFEPEFAIQDGKALMRVTSISAVSLVSEGAICPDGL